MRKTINRLLSLLPFRWKGLSIDDSHRYWLISPALLRGGQSIVSGYVNGQWVFDWLSVHVPLDPESAVLDVGCGDGRVAAAFARPENHFTGRYYGFDIDRKRLSALIRLFQGNERFNFVHADIYHSYYNPGGTIPAESYRFPYADASFDLIWFNSIFTHLKLSVIAHNLREAFRCLAPAGKAWATAYLLDEHGGPDDPPPDRRFETTYDQGFTATPDNPEGCVAYRLETILGLAEDIGFAVEKHIPGYWRAPRRSLDQHEQDVLVLVKQ